MTGDGGRVCRRCGRPIGIHFIVGRDDPTPDLPEGDFVPTWRGLYCPPPGGPNDPCLGTVAPEAS